MTGAAAWTSTTRADHWEGGVAVGDGRVGGLLWGGPQRHELVLAHERVVLPADPPRSAPDLAADLPRIRALLAKGDGAAASQLGVARSVEEGYPGLQWTDPLVPVAAIRVESGEDGVDYRRGFDPDTGVATVSWRDGAGAHGIRALVSRRRGSVVLELTGLAADQVRLVLPENDVRSDAGVRGGNEDRIAAASEGRDGAQVLRLRFSAPWSFEPAGATTVLVDRREASRVLLLADVRPGLLDDEEADAIAASLLALPPDFDALVAEHLPELAAAASVVRLHPPAPRSGATTEQLLADPSSVAAAELLALQHRAGQATIAASTGELPPTLQGVWSGTFDPAWSSDYTMNGNMQNGSVAALLGTGNAGLLRTWLDLLEGFAEDFRDNARLLFGATGFLLPSRCSPTHGRTTHFDAEHCHEFWTAGGAWAAAFFFDLVWHTGDLAYLAEHAYPFGMEVERFLEDFLVIDSDGGVRFTPSYSPENESPTWGSQACVDATMDAASLRRLMADLRRAARLLGRDGHLDARRAARAEGVPPYRVAPDGTLAEWLDPGVVERPEHRTASQLYGLWFEPDERIEGDERLLAAVRELVAVKLRWRAGTPGAEEMAYGLVQLGLAAVAADDAGAAAECLRRLSRYYFLPSLMSTHEPGAIFNADASGGLPALVGTMLASSRVGRVHVLPAFGAVWPEGSATGLHLRGALVLEELRWSPDAVDAVIRAMPGAGTLRGHASISIRWPRGFDGPSTCPIEDGERVRLSARAG